MPGLTRKQTRRACGHYLRLSPRSGRLTGRLAEGPGPGPAAAHCDRDVPIHVTGTVTVTGDSGSDSLYILLETRAGRAAASGAAQGAHTQRARGEIFKLSSDSLNISPNISERTQRVRSEIFKLSRVTAAAARAAALGRVPSPPEARYRPH